MIIYYIYNLIGFKLVPFFIFIDRLELYNYHQTDYNGVIAEMLSSLDTLKQK